MRQACRIYKIYKHGSLLFALPRVKPGLFLFTHIRGCQGMRYYPFHFAFRSSLFAHRSPLTAHRSPLTAHRSPLPAPCPHRLSHFLKSAALSMLTIVSSFLSVSGSRVSLILLLDQATILSIDLILIIYFLLILKKVPGSVMLCSSLSSE